PCVTPRPSGPEQPQAEDREVDNDPDLEQDRRRSRTPLHPSWDTVGSPVDAPQCVLVERSNLGGVVGPAERSTSTHCGASTDQEQPTLWRMARDWARAARRRPCTGVLANGFDSSSENDGPITSTQDRRKSRAPLHPSWDTVGSPDERARGDLLLRSNLGG